MISIILVVFFSLIGLITLHEMGHFLLAKKFDDFFRQLQKKRMEKKTRQPDNEATGVVISDAVLKFHEQDRRREFRTRFENNLRKHL